ncbi:DUF2169 domain-containing protein [Hyalangium rubrum]|uniref:DUF2169 domain-containing protein n=1 Tax=Hyalangium rubrum TaxID=3103134 RepID=A0ABU5GUJ5_9BACT|nr:DUF2169 domain-containing protein [Hyalangium sp. s54d21]MDY7224855.1 DUF2169 domain-containing protein [Hyalangium sp. s54d21]
MKGIKPQRLGILTRPFEHEGVFHFAVSVLAFFSFEAPSQLLSEVELWKFLPKELGKDAALDMGMPKAHAEVLLTAKAYPAGSKGQGACPVRLRLGKVDKTLYAVGDRFWKGGVPTQPLPFKELPITYANAYGGAGYPQNPLGKGFAPVRTPQGELHPLPNIENPKQLVSTPKDKRMPAGFGPYDLTWPQRFSKTGTYDEKWMKERFPGFAKDIDWTFFNTAPEDQQFDGYLQGDEPFTLENMHPAKPVLQGRLPHLKARAFINQKTDKGEEFRELSTRLDTVHLFPHAERGVLVFRAVTQVTEDDAADVLQLMVACEAPDAPRPLAHYRGVLAERLDREKGYLAALRDSDLMPPAAEGAKPAWAELPDLPPAPEKRLEKNLRKRAELEMERIRQEIRAQGLDPDKHVPKALPPEPPPPKLEELGAVIQTAMATADEQLRQAEANRTKAEQEARAICKQLGLDYDQVVAKHQSKQGGPPAYSADAELARMKQSVADLKALGVNLPNVEAQVQDPALEEKLRKTEAALLLSYRISAHHQPAASRLPPEEAARVRQQVLALFKAGESFEGRDLTGADLSRLELPGANFRGALMESVNLSGADLSGADFTGAVLARADLSEANLSGTVFAGANLGQARLVKARMAEPGDLSRVILARADLTRASLRGARMEGVDLSEAVVAGADLGGVVARELTLLRTDLSGIKLAGADLRKSNFIEVTVAGVDFTGATLTGAVFVTCKGDGACFYKAQLDNLRLVKDCSFAKVDFREANLQGANLRSTRLEESDFSQATLKGADLSESNLQRARFYRAVAPEARFMKADLTDAHLVSCNLMQGILQKARIQGADFRGANLFRVDFARVRGSAKSLQDANVKQVRILPRSPHG